MSEQESILEGECWACGKHGDNLTWWSKRILPNQRLSCLVHHGCKERAQGRAKTLYDGKLVSIEGKGDAEIAIFDNNPHTSLLSLSGGYSAEHQTLYIDPQQALSLLLWFMQKRKRLQDMIYAPKGGDDAH